MQGPAESLEVSAEARPCGSSQATLRTPHFHLKSHWSLLKGLSLRELESEVCP